MIDRHTWVRATVLGLVLSGITVYVAVAAFTAYEKRVVAEYSQQRLNQLSASIVRQSLNGFASQIERSSSAADCCHERPPAMLPAERRAAEAKARALATR